MLSEEERKAKENALSGLTGGSFGEIVVLLLVVPVRNLFSIALPFMSFLDHQQPSHPSSVRSPSL